MHYVFFLSLSSCSEIWVNCQRSEKRSNNTQEIKRTLFNLHVLSCFVQLKCILLISCVFWISCNLVSFLLFVYFLGEINGFSRVREIMICFLGTENPGFSSQAEESSFLNIFFKLQARELTVFLPWDGRKLFFGYIRYIIIFFFLARGIGVFSSRVRNLGVSYPWIKK